MKNLILPPLLSLLPGLAAAQSVVVDLPVTAALAQAVLGDVPILVLAEGQPDPHGISLKPSQARALSDADLIIQMGSGISPAIERAIAGADTPTVSLAADHGKEAMAAHDNHDDPDHDHDHDHENGDPHIWLDPTHAPDWLGAIATAARAAGLSVTGDPVDVSAETLLAGLRADLPDPLPGVLVSHDSWGPLTGALGLDPFEAISDSHASAPGARHLQEVRERIEAGEITCVLLAPGDPRDQVDALIADYGLTLVTADPQGDAALEGLARYRSVFTGFVAALRACDA